MNRFVRTFLLCVCGGVLVAGILAVQSPAGAAPASAPEAPRFEVDPMWPKPLPHHWILGMTVGVAVDAQDHIWIVHRPDSLEYWETYSEQQPPIGDCCAAAPPVLEFDEAGNLINSWGGPGEGYDWPYSMHGISIDPDGNVWIGGNGRGKRKPPAVPSPWGARVLKHPQPQAPVLPTTTA